MSFSFAFLILFAYAGLRSSEATLGVDVSDAVSEATWSCLAGNGNSFAIIQAYRSTGEVDSNAVDNVKNAEAGGITYIDGYLSPCFPCGNPAGQLSDAVRNLDLNGAIVGQLWLSIVDSAQWVTPCDSNVAFIQALVDEAARLGVIVAIASNENSWQTITCDNTAFSDLQLWYSNLDGNRSFNDYVPFGGWVQPAIKQYEANVTLCGIKVNQDFY